MKTIESVEQELERLKTAVREYLKRPSLDGAPIRQEQRRKLAELVKDKDVENNCCISKQELDAAIERMKEIVSMDFRAMTPTEKVKIIGEVLSINAQFKAVGHDCSLETLLVALEALKTNLNMEV